MKNFENIKPCMLKTNQKRNPYSGPLPFPEGQPWTPSLAWESYAKHFPNIPKVWKS